MVRCEASGAHCPKCGAWSEAFHGSYERNLGDLPIAGRQAVIDLRVRRFRCYWPECPRKTFVEQAPILAERYAHRTRRLRSLLEEIGLALGGRPGSRHCQRLAIPTSRTTLLRKVRGLPERPSATPSVLGVDEFAFRKGRRYGTILVDGAAHRIVDLLEDRSADALVEWLDNHPGVRVICRDRAGVYASAARRGAPDAQQVADRWHLVHNLADALERFAVRVLASLRKELKAEAIVDATPRLDLPPPASPGRLMARTEQRHAEIHELMTRGLTITAISRRLRLERKTVRRYATAEVAADLLGARGHRDTALDSYLPYLAKRWQDGQHVAACLFDEIKKRGYRGSKRTVRRQLAGWRTAEPPPPAHVMLPGPRTLAWLLLRRPSDLDEKEHVLLRQLYERSAELGRARQLAQDFLRLVRERPVASWTNGSPTCTRWVRQNYVASAAISNMTGMRSTPGSPSAGVRAAWKGM
ncbi:MAG: ISL3 family transposase [Chloroflexi bacterium]|nr:ISL3 family transposase [Chloroflexota bacterium]